MSHGCGNKVVVAMSGGVDSSVAAALLVEQGWEVVGCFLRLGEGTGQAPDSGPDTVPVPSSAAPRPRGCCSLDDAADARQVAARLGIPLYVLNFRPDFDRLIDHFVAQYNAGRTPNPCIRCNQWLKFGRLLDYARSIDAPFIATGHYARIQKTGQVQYPGSPAHDCPPANTSSIVPVPFSGPRLLRAVDSHKDQSYVLFGLTPDRLRQAMFPVGDLLKTQVRDLARRRGLPVHDKPDSQDICFAPDRDYAAVIRQRNPAAMTPGDVLDAQGRAIGRHRGHQAFTVGQRRGLGVAVGRPVYVIAKDAAANTITVGPPDALLATGLLAEEVNWLVEPPAEWRPCQVKVRHHTPAAPARVRAGPDASGRPHAAMEVQFDRPVAAVTPGQAAVAYDGDQVLGGGWIRCAQRG